MEAAEFKAGERNGGGRGDQRKGGRVAHYADIGSELDGRFYDEIERLIAETSGDTGWTISRMRCFTSTNRIAFGSSPSCR